jgi:integrase/recombinase XerD
MSLAFDAAVDEYLSWLQLEANRSSNTVRAYRTELGKLRAFLAAHHHSLELESFGLDDLRAYQRHLAQTLKSPASRQRALVAIRSWLRWLARDELVTRDLSNKITLPKVEQRLPRPLPADELERLLSSLPSETPLEKRDRALVYFLISTGCRISEALALDRMSIPKRGSRVIVSGKGGKERTVYLTDAARGALDDYLDQRTDTSLALFVNYDRSTLDRRLTAAGARHVVRRLRAQLGTWSFKSPHVARHTTATTLLEVTGGDVRLVQEILGHATLGTLQAYTKVVDERKQEAYRLLERHLQSEVGRGGPEDR